MVLSKLSFECSPSKILEEKEKRYKYKNNLKLEDEK